MKSLVTSIAKIRQLLFHDVLSIEQIYLFKLDIQVLFPVWISSASLVVLLCILTKSENDYVMM